MKSQIDNNNSNISPKARVFRNVRCVNSTISDYCTIGDDCDLDAVVMQEKSELGRRNLIRNSILGRGSYTGTNTIIKNTTIGKYCSLAWNISIGGGNHNYHNISTYSDYWYKRTFGVQFDKEVDGLNEIAERVTVGNDVWIGSGVTVLNGRNIGDGCIIGAGAIVTKDVEPYSIILGAPGKVYKKRFDDEIITLLLQLRWWDWPESLVVERIKQLRDNPDADSIKSWINNK
jgi:acetyltransferase-like isoleucine patch superfamily enzyme